MTDTTNLALPYIMAAQAQKHITHNEALRKLDAIVHISVLDRDLAAPPPSPGEGNRYLVAASASGDWTDHTDDIAAYQDGAWAFYTPNAGWVAWIADENILMIWDGASWTTVGVQSVNPVSMVGIEATADTTNRLSLASEASLFNHAGTNHRLKINKASAGDTASQLFQTGFSGRAEIGTTGDDDFHFKVSNDGTTWHESIVISAATGVPRLPIIAKATLPSAVTAAAGATVMVPDEAGGAVLAFSDGTSWRRVTDRAVVS
jgi:Protein of unknown function (DUF2793)